MRNEQSVIERSPNQAIDFSEALAQWTDYEECFGRKAPGSDDEAMTKRAAEFEMRCAAETRAAHKAGTCEMCGWPRGQRGFVRFPFPVGHALFGKAVKCPRCNH